MTFGAGIFVVSAADWLLDNFYLVASEISDIRRNLPRTYSCSLPTLASREHAGHARIYAIAVELIRHSDSRLDRQQLIQFLNSYQRVAPLTIGELWAWPSMLKLALIENLRGLADELLSARAARSAADAYISGADGGDGLGALPSGPDPAFIVQLLHRVREYGLRLAAIRTAVDDNLAARHLSARPGATRRARGVDDDGCPARGRAHLASADASLLRHVSVVRRLHLGLRGSSSAWRRGSAS